MKRLLPILVLGLLVGSSHKYPYTGNIADAERAILAEPRANLIFPEARGTNWIRYRMARDVSGLWVTNGAATVRIENGRAILNGSGEVRVHIIHALKLK
jgi:hypothetical protein